MQTTAFVGVAHIHTPGFIGMIKERGDVRVKAIYDLQAERGEKRAQELGATFTADLQTILDDAEITSVIICSETSYHVELVEKCAAAGKNLFVEKPLATTVEDAERIRAAVQKADVVFQTGFFMRSSAWAQFIKAEVEAGHLGKVTRMRHSNCHSGSLGGWFDGEWHWIVEKELAGGGGFADLGAHALDIVLNTLTKTEGKVVQTAASIRNVTDKYDIDENGTGLITFESGATAVVEAGWVDPKLSSPIEVFGTRGQIQIVGDKVHYYSELLEGADGNEYSISQESAPHAFNLFFDKLDGKETIVPLVTIEEAAEEAIVMAKLYEAAGV